MFQEHYAQFYSHITCEAIHNEDLVPVTNRRCLCELAKQIGFIDQAQDIFELEEQLCTFKHVVQIFTFFFNYFNCNPFLSKEIIKFINFDVSSKQIR